MNISFSDSLSLERLARALATEGLGIDAHVGPNGCHRVVELPKPHRCGRPGCQCESTYRVEGDHCCPNHLMENLRNGGAL